MQRFTLIILFLISGVLEARTIRIAAIYPISQPANYDRFGLEAWCVTKAVLEDAKKNGLDIAFEPFNTSSDPIHTGVVAKQIAKENYDIAIGTLVSVQALAAAPIFEDAGLPFIVPTASHPDVTKGRKYVTRIPFNDFRQAELLAKLTASDLRPKSVAIIRNVSEPYSNFLGKEYAKKLHELAPQIGIKDYPVLNGFNNHAELIESILKEKRELIFVPLIQSNVSSFYSELSKQGAKVTLLGSDIVENDVDFLGALGKISPHIRFIFVQHWDRLLRGPSAALYRRIHETTCSKYPDSMVASAAFDSTMLLVEALRAKKEFSKENFIPTIKALNFSGLMGPIVYGPDGDPIKPLQLFTVDRSKTVFLKEFP